MASAGLIPDLHPENPVVPASDDGPLPLRSRVRPTTTNPAPSHAAGIEKEDSPVTGNIP
jgi:hypothetical protein